MSNKRYHLLLALLLPLIVRATTSFQQSIKKTLTPLKKYSFHFQQEQLKIPTTQISKESGVIVSGYIPKGTVLQNLKTNKTLVTGKELTVKAFIPTHNQNFVFILDKSGKQRYRIKTSNFIDLTSDLAIAPTPTHYIEYPAKIRSNEIDKGLHLSTSLLTSVGIIQSNFFTNFTQTNSTIMSGFRLQQNLELTNIALFTLLDYSSYSLIDVNKIVFSSWKYGVGLRYHIPLFDQPTFLQLAVLGDLRYRGSSTTGIIDLTSNSLELSIDRIKQTKYFNLKYGLLISKEQLSIAKVIGGNLPTEKESAYNLQAYIGVNIDYHL